MFELQALDIWIKNYFSFSFLVLELYVRINKSKSVFE